MGIRYYNYTLGKYCCDMIAIVYGWLRGWKMNQNSLLNLLANCLMGFFFKFIYCRKKLLC